MNKVKIGVLASQIGNTNDLLGYIYTEGEPRLILPYNKLGGVDILIVPDQVGINPSLQCLREGDYQAFPMGPMCPVVEWFRHRLPEIMQKVEVIIGIGEGAVPLWDFLEGKIAITKGGRDFDLLYNPKMEVEVIGQQDYCIRAFRRGGLIGLKAIQDGFSKILNAEKNDILVEAIKAARDIEDNLGEEFVA